MATLKISDLSVGDWVGIDQAELNMPSDDLATAYIEKLRKPIRIKGISEDSDMVIADIEIVDEWGSIMMKCEHLRPITFDACNIVAFSREIFYICDNPKHIPKDIQGVDIFATPVPTCSS